MFLGINVVFGLCSCDAIRCCWEVGLEMIGGFFTGCIVGGMIGCLAVFRPSSAATC